MADGKFYFIVQSEDSQGFDGAEYELSSTSQISVSSPARVTSSRVESGKSLTDNYFKENKTVSFNGVISNIKKRDRVATGEWLAEIEAIRNLDPPPRVTVISADYAVKNCIIEQFDFDKTAVEGLSAWKVSFTFKEVEYIKRANRVEIKEPSPATKDTVSSKSKGGNEATVDKHLTTTTGQDLAEKSGSLIGSAVNAVTGGDNGGSN